jgi:hypothetical protein
MCYNNAVVHCSGFYNDLSKTPYLGELTIVYRIKIQKTKKSQKLTSRKLLKLTKFFQTPKRGEPTTSMAKRDLTEVGPLEDRTLVKISDASTASPMLKTSSRISSVEKTHSQDSLEMMMMTTFSEDLVVLEVSNQMS